MKYFLHDTSAFEDEKISELFIEFGYEGLGLFYTILEKLAKQEKPVKTSVLKHQLKVGKRLEKYWSFMEEIELISSSNGETFNKQLLNFSEKYQIKKEKNAKKISEWREKQSDTKNVTGYEPICNSPKVKESKVNKSKCIINTWRNDFEIYKSELSEWFENIKTDFEYLSEQEKFNPGIDVILSIEKSIKLFWGTEAGWKNKKSSKTVNIDWKSTIAKNLDKNKVYKQNESNRAYTKNGFNSPETGAAIAATERIFAEYGQGNAHAYSDRD